MISPTVLKVGLSLVAVFGCGGVCGYTVATRQWLNPSARAHLEDRWMENRRREDARRLQLSVEQIERVSPAYEQMAADIRTVREEAARGITGAVVRQAQALQAQLTPAQKADFARLNEERRTRWQKAASP